ncbi:malate dehydrogenase (quinone) [Haliscomenobacter hydrossis]|uniref:Probable malate:quinone oxidoreductase n=1 Tax=Haliscomenobacter hydrossis (strain ATCC 27775 / DSM 1100 / LMG 10767 / O) TaxID=760192 RepID=F4L4I8_HALH1|nr:malate dehydrogenase (quinone) [Haliscomenobacter hydrossis]AEE51989.1 malate:quinone oxidoreductase [Haliscomenobacter hydrossis DSM 1100]
MTNSEHQSEHIVLIGAGIMSATLGILLKELNPRFHISIYERLDQIAAESSDAWNNAGTGHSAFCELNYTPQDEKGQVDIKKAIKIASNFELSKAFWSYLVKADYFADPEAFINNTPHISFVWGAGNVAFLKARYTALQAHPLFAGMEYSEDPAVLKTWMPLVMEGRDATEKVAATKVDIGTDINFGNLARVLFKHLTSLPNVHLHLLHEVRDLEKQEDDTWQLKIKNLQHDEKIFVKADFVFIGAGGGALPLLDKSDIEEARGYGGFPVSGQWLVCNNESIIAEHNVKVYGKASVGAPPMSVPHLDTRLIDGKKALLFGPFAGFTTKFLKNGSYFDLPLSIELDNFIPMLSAGWNNLALTRYLIQQATLSHADRIKALREYYPHAKADDWELAIAGQRVQVIKKDEEEGGVLEFGTEIIHAADGSLAALLGASPGASTSVAIMLEILEKCFAKKMQSSVWQKRLKKMIPLYGKAFKGNEKRWLELRKYNNSVLHLND